MRVKDPLRALKSFQGHTVMHLTFFVASFFINTCIYEPGDSQKNCDMPPNQRFSSN